MQKSPQSESNFLWSRLKQSTNYQAIDQIVEDGRILGGTTGLKVSLIVLKQGSSCGKGVLMLMR